MISNARLGSISEFVNLVHCGKSGHRYVALLAFKFDESYDDTGISLGGWVGEEREWRLLESQWRKCIDQQNSRSAPNQKISRFHAAQMNGYKEEFKHWNGQMSREFCGKLIRIINKRRLGLVSCAGSIDVLHSVFTQESVDKKADAYGLLLKFLMVELGHLMRDHFAGDQVIIVHDSSDYDATALEAFKSMVNDLDWPNRSVFHLITPLAWRESIGLQAADLAAYKTFKALKNNLQRNDKSLRFALDWLRVQKQPMRAKYVDENAAAALRDLILEKEANDRTRNI